MILMVTLSVVSDGSLSRSQTDILEVIDADTVKALSTKELSARCEAEIREKLKEAL